MYLILYGNKYLYVSIGCLRGCSFDASIKGVPRCNKASSQVGTLPTYIPTAANDRVDGVFHSAVTIDNAIVTSKSGDLQEESVSVFVNNGGKMITIGRFSSFDTLPLNNCALLTLFQIVRLYIGILLTVRYHCIT